jgi:hypothetical protein
MAKTYSLEDFASESPQTYSLADFGGAPEAETYSLKDFELPSQTSPQLETPAPVAAREEPVAPPVQEPLVAEQAPIFQAQTPVVEQAPAPQLMPTQAEASAQPLVQPPALGGPTQEELAAASQPAFVYRKPGGRAKPVIDPNAINMPGSVMDKQVAPPSEFEQTSKAPIRPEVRAAFNSQWDAATPEQRETLARQPGLTGQLAREREELFTKQAEALGGVPADNTLRKVDPRVEERRARLIAEGEDPEFAALIARLSTERGIPPGQEIAAIGTIEPSEFDFETNRFFRDQVGANNPLVRGTAKAVLGLGKAALGVNEFLADSIGADKYAKFLKEGNKWIREKEGAVGEKGDFLERNLEGAISSIGQQLPWMIGAVATGGGAAIPLIAIGVQTFGQEYSDGRAQKQDVQQAATRASIFAAFEVIGEKFGLTDQLKALRGAAKGMENSEIVKLLANALKKEIPGELFTTTGQFAADKWMPQGYALNPNATVEDFVEQVADTIAQTILQAGVMGAGTTGVSTARRFMSERGYGESIAAADAEAARTAALNKWQTQGVAPSIYAGQTPTELTSELPVTKDTPSPPDPSREEPTFTLDPETGEVSPITPTGETAEITEAEALIEREAQRYAKTYNLPLDLATEVVRGQYARGELDDGARTGVDAGRVEPSISMPVEGATTPEGVTPSDTSGLVDTVGDIREPDAREGAERTALDESQIPTLTQRADPVVLAEMKLANAELAVAEATTPEAKKAATKERNKARQELQKVQATAPVVEAPVVEAPVTEPVIEEPTAPVLSEQDQTRLQSAQREVIDAQDTLNFLAEQGFTSPDEHYGVESAQRKIASAQEIINELQPHPVTPAPTAATVEATTETTAKPAVKKWFGNSKAVDSKGEPLVLYRGLVGGQVDPFSGRSGYAIFTSDNPYIASSYSGDPTAEFGVAEGVVYPMYAKVDTVVEFPLDRNGMFDKFEFDKRAKTLKPGEALVARNVMDTGPRMSSKMAEQYPKKSGDVWAFGNGTKFQSAISPTAPKRGRPAKPVVEGAAPVAPKKRGRPSAKEQLTPEQLAYKEAERQQNQEDLIKASRGVNKVIKAIEFVPDMAKYKTPEEFQMAQVAAASARKTAIYRLHQYATAPAFRSAKASGIKAAQYLASDKITPKERADLQARLEFEKNKGPKPSAARSKTTEKPVKAFYGFDRASQAIDHIIRNGTPFERALAARLKPLIGDVRLTVADTKENTPDAIQDLLGDAAGVYSSAQFGDKVHRMIVLRGENFDDPALQGVNNIIFLHEALHAATEAKIDQWQELTSLGLPVPPQLQMLVNDLFEVMGSAQAQYETLKASGQPISANLRHKFEKLDISNDPKEFVAYGMTDPDVQKFLLNAPGYTRKDQALSYIKNLFNQFVNSLRRTFNMDAKHQSAMQDLMLVTEGLMQEQEIEPAYSVNTVLNAKISKSDIARDKAQLSENSTNTAGDIQKAIQARSFDVYKNALIDGWDSLSNSAKNKILYATPTPNIIDWKGDQIPAFKAIDKAQQYMSGMRQNLLRAYTKQAEAIGTFVRKTGVEGKNAMATAMHLARLENVTPSVFADRVDALQNDPRIVQLIKEAANPTVNVNERAAIDQKLNERRTAINNVFDAWETLGKYKDGHKIYKMVRQYYKDSGALTRALLDRNIDRLNLEGDVNDPSTPKGRLMLSVRRMYEDSEFKGVEEYFPFMRHGPFVLEVQGPLGRERYHFDTEKKRKQYIRERAGEINADPEDGNVFKVYRDLENENRDRFAAESRMLTDMFNAVEAATEANTLDKEALKDELYQIYLTTLPEQSFRKQYMHADNVTGFSADVLRNFKTYANRMAAQAAKLRYAPEIVDAIQRAKDTLEGMPPAQQSELGIFVDEMARRGMEEINPTPENKYANLAAQAAFYMLLTGAGSAAVQTTALPVYVMPALNANYGYGKAAASFAKWGSLYKSLGFTTENVDGVKQLIAPTVAESSLVRNNPLLQRAFNEATARDLVGQSLSSNIIDLRRTPDSAVDSLAKNSTRIFLNTTAGLFSGSERLTREISFMMAFELEYAKSGDFDKSVDAAADIVQRYVGRFDRFARPPAMRGWGKVPLQFKNYSALVTTFLIRNAAQAITGSGAGRMVALNTLGGILLLGALFFGVPGLPLYGVITAAIDAALESLEDEEGYLHKVGKRTLGNDFAKRMVENKRRRIEKDQFTATNSDMRFRYEFLPKWTGGITFGGEDGKRYSLATMLERGPISVMSDVNIGPRMSLDGIWFKDVRQSEDFKEKLGNWVEALAAPPVTGAVEKIVDGVNDIIDDKPLKGASQVLPPAYGNILKSELVRQEGVKTRRGDMVISKDELSTTNIIAQATGLGSTRAAALQDKNFKTRNEILIAQERKNKVLEEFRNLVADPKNDGSPDYLKKWDAFFKKYDRYNARYPMERTAITPESLNKVAENELEAQANSARGLRVKEQLRDYILPRHYDYIRQVMGGKS